MVIDEPWTKAKVINGLLLIAVVSLVASCMILAALIIINRITGE